MQSAGNGSDRAGAAVRPMLTLGVLFFVFGFVTWLNGPLITFVKLAFDLDDLGAFLVPMAFYLSYFFLALPSAAILRRTGMKRGMALGLFVMSAGAVAFGHFATARVYPGALTGLFAIGAGLSLLQTAANPYVSVVGPHERAAQRIAVMGLANKFAGILAPIVFGALVLDGLSDFDDRVKAAADPASRELLLQSFASKVYLPYLAMAALLALLGVAIVRSRLPELAGGSPIESAGRSAHELHDQPGLGSYPHLWLGVLCLFLYVGVEVMAGDAIGVYGAGFGLPLDATRLFTSYTLFAMMVGYAAGLIIVPRFFSQETYLALSGLLGIVLTAIATVTSGYVSVGCIAALGFANAMMWPAIFPLAIRDLGRHTETGAALLIMAIAGGALLPYAFAVLKLSVNFQHAYAIIAIPAYAFIAYYGVCGHRL